jgi:hypothetical protein
VSRRLLITSVAAAAIAGAVVPSFAATTPPSPSSRQALPGNPVVIRHDDTGTTVGVGQVGVQVSPDGQVCPLVSTQSWQCVGGDR